MGFESSCNAYDKQGSLRKLHCSRQECVQVVLACSIDATLRQDRQLSGQSVNFVSADTAKAQRCSDLGLEQLEVTVC